MVDLIVGLAICVVVAWVVCVPLAKITGDYEATRYDREHGNVPVPRSTAARRRRVGSRR